MELVKVRRARNGGGHNVVVRLDANMADRFATPLLRCASAPLVFSNLLSGCGFKGTCSFLPPLTPYRAPYVQISFAAVRAPSVIGCGGPPSSGLRANGSGQARIGETEIRQPGPRMWLSSMRAAGRRGLRKRPRSLSSGLRTPQNFSTQGRTSISQVQALRSCCSRCR